MSDIPTLASLREDAKLRATRALEEQQLSGKAGERPEMQADIAVDAAATVFDTAMRPLLARLRSAEEENERLRRKVETWVVGQLPEIDRLECQTCGCRVPVKQDEVVEYIAHGWPGCCGYTMRIITAAEDVRVVPDRGRDA